MQWASALHTATLTTLQAARSTLDRAGSHRPLYESALTIAGACMTSTQSSLSALVTAPSIQEHHMYSQVGCVIVAGCHVVKGIQRLGGRSRRGLREGSRQTGQEDRRQQDEWQCTDCHGCKWTMIQSLGWKCCLSVLLCDPMSVTRET
jgi:hypothetical protein